MSEKSSRPPSFFFPSVLLGAGIALGFTLLGTALYKSVSFFKTSDHTISVRGLAEEIVQSDKGTLRFSVVAYGDSVPSTYAKIKDNLTKTMQFLQKHGFTEKEISYKQSAIIDGMKNNYSEKQTPKEERYSSEVAFTLVSSRIDDLEKVLKDIPKLIEQDILYNNAYINYTCSQFTEIRPNLIKKATIDAQSAAKQLANELNVVLGNAHSIQQGLVEMDGDREKTLRVVLVTKWGIEPHQSHQ